VLKAERLKAKGERAMVKSDQGNGDTMEQFSNATSDKSQIRKIVIDRITKNEEDETISRLGDSIQTAFFEGKGDCYVRYQEPDADTEPSVFLRPV
jgi:excinuclease ABC subunit A